MYFVKETFFKHVSFSKSLYSNFVYLLIALFLIYPDYSISRTQLKISVKGLFYCQSSQNIRF